MDIGSLTRLDFFNVFIPKNLSRSGADRFALFGYDTEDNFYWQGVIGPLNIMIFLICLMPIVTLLTIVGCKMMKLTLSRRINFAAQAFLFSAFDRFLTHAQLHLLILTMFSFRDKNWFACFLLILIMFWHLFARHYNLYKIEQPTKFTDHVANYKKEIVFSSFLMAFKDGSSRHAQL